MRCLNNSNTEAFRAKAAELGSAEYTERVAGPVMSAIDAMPPAYRALVNEFGYVDVYLAWRKGVKPAAIIAAAKDGMFKL